MTNNVVETVDIFPIVEIVKSLECQKLFNVRALWLRCQLCTILATHLLWDVRNIALSSSRLAV